MIMAAATLAMGYPVLLYALGRNIRFLQDLGFQSGPRGTPTAWVLALIVAVTYSVATIRSIPLVAQHWRAPTPLKGLALVLALAAGIVEEAVFRRMIMDSIMQAGGAVWLQVLASGLLFGIAHASWGLIKGNFAVARSAAIATTILGGALAIIYVLGGRSLARVLLPMCSSRPSLSLGSCWPRQAIRCGGKRGAYIPPAVHRLRETCQCSIDTNPRDIIVRFAVPRQDRGRPPAAVRLTRPRRSTLPLDRNAPHGAGSFVLDLNPQRRRQWLAPSRQPPLSVR
jgi:hypothetical protein